MVDIVNIQFTDEYTGSGASKCRWIMGGVGDKITSYVQVGVHWESLDILMRFKAVDKTITREDNVSWIDIGFRQGDTVAITNTVDNNGTFTIAAMTDRVITTVEALTNEVAEPANIYGTTNIDALDFYFNLIPNDANISMLSLTDNETSQKKQAYKASWAAAQTVSLSRATNSLGWDTGTGSVTKNDTVAHVQYFTITHTFFITPFFLAGQKNAMIGAFIAPDYFRNTSCLKYVCQVDARTSDIRNPDVVHSTSDNYKFLLGNTGWFNEFLNGGAADYTLQSIAYEDANTGDPLDQIDFMKNTQVTIVLKSAAGSFKNKLTGPPPLLGSPMVVNLIYCPLDQDDYVNTETTLPENFRQDRKLITIGAAAANGEQFGTNRQSITTLSATFTDVNTCTVIFTATFSSAIKTFLQGKDANNRFYAIWITPQAYTVASLEATDRNPVLCDFQTAAWNRDDSTQLTWQDVVFYQYPDTTTNAYTDYKGFIQDGVLAKSAFQVKRGSKLKDYTFVIEAYQASTGDSFPLDQFSIGFEDRYIAVDNIICDSTVKVRDFKLSPEDPRNQIAFQRNESLDTVTLVGYSFYYGFMFRYEDWRTLPEFNKAFTCDHTQNWSVYSLATGWVVRVRMVANVEADDYTTEFIRTASLQIKDQAHSADGHGGTLSCVITTEVVDGAGYASASGLIAADTLTHVTATITGNFATLPAGFCYYWGYLGLDLEGEGGQNFLDKATTQEDPVAGSLWVEQATLTKVNNTTITIEADVNASTIDPTKLRYLLSASLQFKNSNCP